MPNQSFMPVWMLGYSSHKLKDNDVEMVLLLVHLFFFFLYFSLTILSHHSILIIKCIFMKDKRIFNHISFVKVVYILFVALALFLPMLYIIPPHHHPPHPKMD